MMAVFSYLLFLPFFIEDPNDKIWQIYWLLAPISVVMIALCICGVIDAAKARFVLETDRVWYKGVFADRELLLHQVAGYRTDDKYIYLIPNEKGLKRIKISRYFGGTAEILDWLSQRYPDLDEQKAEQERQHILSDNNLGFTVEQREEKLVAARKQAKALNWAAGVVAVWVFFFPRPYEPAILATMAIPLIGLLSSRFSNGLIRLQEIKGGAYPSVFSAIFFPSLGLCIRALIDFDILEYGNAWKGMFLVASLFMMITLIRSKEFLLQSAKEYGIVLFFAVLALAYGFGAAVTLNCVYDESPALVYGAQVLEKRVSGGKTTTYYLRLTPWGPRRNADDVSVGKAFYDRIQVKDDVQVYLRKGRFSIPWFVIAR